MIEKMSFLDSNLVQTGNIVLCEIHQNECKTFKIDSQDDSNLFQCHICVIQEKQDYQTVPISQVCSYNDSTVILSWPPLDDQTLLQKVDQISQQYHTKQTQCDKIVEFFDQFTKQILSKINEKKQSILSQAENAIKQSQQIQKVYQQIASLQELKEIIEDNKTNITKKSELISKLIKKKNSEKSQNTQLINLIFHEQNIQQFFDIHVFNQFKTTLISQIELLDYNNQIIFKDFISFIQQTLSIQNSFNNPNQTNSNHYNIQDNSNLDKMIKLISNKSNSCSEKYLYSVKTELNKLQSMINKLNIEKEVFLPNKQQISIDFTNFETFQIENIQFLSEQMKIFNQQYNKIKNKGEDNNFLSKQIQPSSFFVMEKISNTLTHQKVSKIEKLLRSYPIFEVEQIIQIIKYDFKIILSGLNNSQSNGKITSDKDECLNFEVINQDIDTISYIRINQYSKYRIRIKMSLKNMNDKYFFIGLVQESYKDQSNIYEKTIINSFVPESLYGDRGVSKVIKGRCLREVKYPEEYNEIEVRICVKERLFEVCDFPKRENINTINDDRLHMIDPNSIYYLGLNLYKIGDKITILEFEEEKMME